MERNRKERSGVLCEIAELFDLPADVVAGLPRLEMVGTGSCIWSATPASWPSARSRSM